jgi:hypothetical protein
VNRVRGLGKEFAGRVVQLFLNETKLKDEVSRFLALIAARVIVPLKIKLRVPGEQQGPFCGSSIDRA